MRMINPSLRFLHGLRKREFLESALRDGLLFTDHPVEFSPTSDMGELKSIVEKLLPPLMIKLNAMGTPLLSMPEDKQKALLFGLGITRGQVPMICFTEVVPGRNLQWHRQMFGAYAIMPNWTWMEKNNADRVIYIGNNSPVSRLLFEILAAANVTALHAAPGLPVFDSTVLKKHLSLLSFVEVRDNVSEVEWRIPGETGFMGGTRTMGDRVPIPLEAIEAILTPRDEIDEVSELVQCLAIEQACNTPPRVRPYEDTLAD
jgi:hypothetical protein